MTTPWVRRTCARAVAAITAATILAIVPAAAQAQAGGRWVLQLGGGVTGTLRGELRLTDQGGRLAGTIWLENGPAPVPLSGQSRERTIAFDAAADGPLRFTATLSGDVLTGEARTDSGPPRRWTATRLDPGREYYPVLPRFTVRQIIAGRGDTLLTVPGPWVAAARRAVPAERYADAYASAARSSGLARLTGDGLSSGAPLRMMGVYRRAELTAAVGATLDSIARQIPDARVAAAFTRLFRPRGAWLTDLHDVALARGRLQLGTASYATAAPALVAIGWLDADSTAAAEPAALALYRFHALSMGDSAAAGALRRRMQSLEPAAYRAVSALLAGYAEGAAWHAEALRFLVTERWIGGGSAGRSAGRSDGRSVYDLVRAASPGDSVFVPEIRARAFGYPQAVPRYGLPQPVFDRIVRADNWPAREWLRRHGPSGLLGVLRMLSLDFVAPATLDAGGETLWLTSVRRHAETSTNGFLEPRDAIVVDPAYVPLLALGAVVHEWQHLIVERRRLGALVPDDTAAVVLPAADPFVAEGIAEWRAERIMAPLAARFPLLGVGEPEKRARLAASRPDDQHVVGYAMVRALREAVPDDASFERLLLAATNDPRAVAADPALARAWAGHPGRDYVVAAPSRRVLVPETTFTVEDNFPDLLGMRIRAPR